MAALYSRIASNAALWSRHEPDYAAQLAVVGPAAASDRATTSTAIVNANAHSPTVVAFMLNADPTKIYIGHSPTRFPADMIEATPFDDHVMVLVGDDLDEASPVVIPAEAFTRSGEYGFYNKTYIKGVSGHTLYRTYCAV